ncbi:hypothetical protein PMI33_03471 [Pseudomonas sp. GM67]|nr:hypothetical protein PMI33_03471 [Pseudomonas sp. GM67]
MSTDYHHGVPTGLVRSTCRAEEKNDPFSPPVWNSQE